MCLTIPMVEADRIKKASLNWWWWMVHSMKLQYLFFLSVRRSSSYTSNTLWFCSLKLPKSVKGCCQRAPLSLVINNCVASSLTNSGNCEPGCFDSCNYWHWLQVLLAAWLLFRGLEFQEKKNVNWDTRLNTEPVFQSLGFKFYPTEWGSTVDFTITTFMVLKFALMVLPYVYLLITRGM